MEDEIDSNRRFERYDKDTVYSTSVRAGKRTYFFDVKPSHQDDFCLIVTESKKRYNREGKVFYEKHKVYIYKEDFDKFSDGLAEAMEYIDNYVSDDAEEDFNDETNESSDYTNLEFDDLESIESSENHSDLKNQ